MWRGMAGGQLAAAHASPGLATTGAAEHYGKLCRTNASPHARRLGRDFALLSSRTAHRPQLHKQTQPHIALMDPLQAYCVDG